MPVSWEIFALATAEWPERGGPNSWPPRSHPSFIFFTKTPSQFRLGEIVAVFFFSFSCCFPFIPVQTLWDISVTDNRF